MSQKTFSITFTIKFIVYVADPVENMVKEEFG
jgi:hypothetical protein